MEFKLSDVNRQLREDPQGLVAEGTAHYEAQISAAADRIQENLKKSPIVLLAGPSGSGKTTTAIKIDHELERRGIAARTISLDNYFRNVDPETAPRTPEGELDFESPACLDLPLLSAHFDALSRGQAVEIPSFDFSAQVRSPNRSTRLQLKENEVAIFEGIHALNPDITGPHPEASRVYVSTRSDFADDRGELCFLAPWLRLVRRVVRDHRYRGASAAFTLGLWANVLRGEDLYIRPYMNTADISLDTALPFEVAVFKDIFPSLLPEIPESVPNFEEYRRVVAAFDSFESLDPALLPESSLLREFIGGSSYHYASGVN